MDPGTIAVFIPIVGIVMGCILLSIPLLGFTVRYAMKPFAESMATLRGAKGAEEKLQIMGQRMQLVEQQIAGFESELHRVSEAQEFQGKLLGAKAEAAD
jgi:hypothetical protein